MGNLKLVCDKCKYEIASLSKDIRTPLIGAMFLSKDIKHSFPPPWSPVVTPEHMYCPMCQFRPFPLPENNMVKIMTNECDMVITTGGLVLADDFKVQFADDSQPEELAPNRGYKFTPVGEKVEKNVQSVTFVGNGNLSKGNPVSTEENEEMVDPVGVESKSDDAPPIPSFDYLLAKGDIIQKGSWFEFEGATYRKADLENILNG